MEQSTSLPFNGESSTLSIVAVAFGVSTEPAVTAVAVSSTFLFVLDFNRVKRRVVDGATVGVAPNRLVALQTRSLRRAEDPSAFLSVGCFSGNVAAAVVLTDAVAGGYCRAYSLLPSLLPCP